MVRKQISEWLGIADSLGLNSDSKHSPGILEVEEISIRRFM